MSTPERFTAGDITTGLFSKFEENEEFVRLADLDAGHGVELIAAERKRQIEEEGWTAEHDDHMHGMGALATAGACYAAFTAGRVSKEVPGIWPWDRKWWKPDLNQLRNLAKAGALIAAEMDRLMRFEEQPRTDG